MDGNEPPQDKNGTYRANFNNPLLRVRVNTPGALTIFSSNPRPLSDHSFKRRAPERTLPCNSPQKKGPTTHH
jgi:hypothetical protein